MDCSLGSFSPSIDAAGERSLLIHKKIEQVIESALLSVTSGFGPSFVVTLPGRRGFSEGDCKENLSYRGFQFNDASLFEVQKSSLTQGWSDYQQSEAVFGRFNLAGFLIGRRSHWVGLDLKKSLAHDVHARATFCSSEFSSPFLGVNSESVFHYSFGDYKDNGGESVMLSSLSGSTAQSVFKLLQMFRARVQRESYSQFR